MSTNRTRFALAVCAGLLVASSAWIINTQLGQILPYIDCQQQARYSAIASFAGVVASCLAGAISWRASNRASMFEPMPVTLGFVGSISALAASVFAFALSMQGLASLVLSGCER
jgi:hypothetical protein